MNTSKNKLLEWSGVITAIIYSILVALNIGAEFVVFFLLLTSATKGSVYVSTQMAINIL